MMSRSVQGQLSVWSSSGNPAKFVQSNSYRINCKQYAMDLQRNCPAPVAIPVVNCLSKINDMTQMYAYGQIQTQCHLYEETTVPSHHVDTGNITIEIDDIMDLESNCEENFLKSLVPKKENIDLKPMIDGLHDEEHVRNRLFGRAMDEMENRKASIKAKILLKKEGHLTQAEERYIHARADMYAISAVPDARYFILPEMMSHPYNNIADNPNSVSSLTPPRKKRRRNYGNSTCFVSHHDHENLFDNTKMLPLGTRLVKPPTKLVELVAQAINGSPDGLLQVQQIYIYLQNKYPFYRYMDRVAINSWRSSIRHALYQKWFRKIRFELGFISSKGCYWAINSKNTPKEWSLPDNAVFNSVENDIQFDFFHQDCDEKETMEAAAKVCELLTPSDFDSDCEQTENVKEENNGKEKHNEESNDKDNNDKKNSKIKQEKNSRVRNKRKRKVRKERKAVKTAASTPPSVPSPVHEQDPILSTCETDWMGDFDLSSEESGNGTMTPSSTSPFLSMDSSTSSSLTEPDPRPRTPLPLTPEQQIDDDYLIIDPLSPSVNPVALDRSANQRARNRKPPRSTANMSPMANWIPNWEDYGSYTLSPENISTQGYVQGLPWGRCTENTEREPNRGAGRESNRDHSPKVDQGLIMDQGLKVDRDLIVDQDLKASQGLIVEQDLKADQGLIVDRSLIEDLVLKVDKGLTVDHSLSNGLNESLDEGILDAQVIAGIDFVMDNLTTSQDKLWENDSVCFGDYEIIAEYADSDPLYSDIMLPFEQKN